MKLYDFLGWIWAATPSLLRCGFYHINAGYSLASLLLPDRMEIVEVQRGISKGMRMELNLRRQRSYYFGIYEEEVQSVLASIVRPGMRVYNLGAHIGFFTIALSRIVTGQGSVVAFEPNPRARQRLAKSLALNGITDRVRVEPCALGDFDGFTEFCVSANDDLGRIADLPRSMPNGVIPVQIKRLDTYVAEENPIPDIILMDVEHAEGRVFAGMSQIMEAYKPIILVEMHGPPSIQEAWHHLRKHHYVLATIPGLQRVTSAEKVRYGHYLAAHTSYFDQKRK